MQLTEGKKRKREGQVRDLVEKLEKGEITRDEVLGEMKKRELHHHAGEPIPGIFSLTGIMIWAILCFLPIICVALGVDFPGIPSIVMPLEIAFASLLFAAVVTPPLFYSVYLREKRSETGDENIVLVKTGAYGIVRHPASLAGLIWLLALPIIFSSFVSDLPFTILSVFGEMAVVVSTYLQIWHEEKINIKKWGDEYRQYMEEVPRLNFFLGFWRRTKRRRRPGES